MNYEIDLLANYRIEVSGWGLDKNFFVEQTNLDWSHDSEKKIWLHHELPVDAIVFVRLMAPEASGTSIPVTYQVRTVTPMNCNGLCEMLLTEMHARFKESIPGRVASKLQEEFQDRLQNSSAPNESPKKRELEEILR